MQGWYRTTHCVDSHKEPVSGSPYGAIIAVGSADPHEAELPSADYQARRIYRDAAC